MNLILNDRDARADIKIFEGVLIELPRSKLRGF